MQQEIVALIDGDSIPYIVAYNNRDNDEPSLVAMEIDQLVTNTLVNTGASKYLGFVQESKPKVEPSDNIPYGISRGLRYDLATIKEYKGNRTVVPEWYIKWSAYIKEYLVTKWGFHIVRYIETDDMIASAARVLRNSDLWSNFVVCSTDKDLDQIVGNHYSPSTSTLYHVDEDTAARKLWTQVLTGDSTDNIQGIPKVGPGKAEKILEGEISEMPFRVLQAYQIHYGLTTGARVFSEMFQLVHLVEQPLGKLNQFVFVPEGTESEGNTGLPKFSVVKGKETTESEYEPKVFGTSE